MTAGQLYQRNRKQGKPFEYWGSYKILSKFPKFSDGVNDRMDGGRKRIRNDTSAELDPPSDAEGGKSDASSGAALGDGNGGVCESGPRHQSRKARYTLVVCRRS